MEGFMNKGNILLSKEELLKIINENKDKINSIYFDYLCSLVNLESSVFSPFTSVFLDGTDLYDKVMRYNILNITQNKISSMNIPNVSCGLNNSGGIISLNDTKIAELNLSPSSSFPSRVIFVHCYEDDNYQSKINNLYLRKESLIEMRNALLKVKTKSSLHKEVMEETKPLREAFSRIRDLTYEIKSIEDCIPMYENPHYREIAYSLLEEYNVPNEEHKTLVKDFPWGKIVRLSR